jgi:hypothetical protein
MQERCSIPNPSEKIAADEKMILDTFFESSIDNIHRGQIDSLTNFKRDYSSIQNITILSGLINFYRL